MFATDAQFAANMRSAIDRNSAPLNRHALFEYAKEASWPDDSNDLKAAS